MTSVFPDVEYLSGVLSMEAKSEIFCVWSGVGFCAVFGIGLMMVVQWWLPPSPTLGAAEISALYTQHRGSIMAGAVLCMIGNGFALPWMGLISLLMWRAGFRLWSFIQLASGVSAAMAPFIAALFWVAAGFRPDRDPQLVLALNDMAWFALLLLFVPALFQFISVGAVGLLADRAQAPWPRWIGYLSLWVATLGLPAALIPFFKTGPFAWNGVLSLWVPLSAFFLWFVVMIPTLMKAVRRQAAATA